MSPTNEFESINLPTDIRNRVLKKDGFLLFLNLGAMLGQGTVEQRRLLLGKGKNHVATQVFFEEELPASSTLHVPRSLGARIAMDVKWDSVGSNEAQYADSNKSDEYVAHGAPVNGILNVKLIPYTSPSTKAIRSFPFHLKRKGVILGEMLDVAEKIRDFKFVKRGTAAMGCRHWKWYHIRYYSLHALMMWPRLIFHYLFVKAGLAEPINDDFLGDLVGILTNRFSPADVDGGSIGEEILGHVHHKAIEKGIFGPDIVLPDFPSTIFANWSWQYGSSLASHHGSGSLGK